MDNNNAEPMLPPDFPTEDAQEYKKRFQEQGVAGCLQYLREKQTDWRNIPLNIAVIGHSGVGKSSFINTIRGLDGDDDGAANVGVNECTMEPTAYKHPNNPNLKLWDLPGVNTPKFPKETYMEKIKFEQYDFFVVLSAGRFTEIDKWLAVEIEKSEKKLYFIRTKVGADIKNDKNAHPKSHVAKKVIDSIRLNIIDNLSKIKIESRYFLIDSYERERGDLDFNELEKYLMKDFPAIKREALVLSLNALSAHVVRRKVEILRSRISSTAMLSAAGTAAPLGWSTSIDETVLKDAVLSYFRQLGLDRDTIKRTARLLSINEDHINVVINEELPYLNVFSGGDLKSDAFQKLINQIINEEKIGFQSFIKTATSFIPLVGWMSSPIAFQNTKLILNHFLDKLQNAALKFVDVYVGNVITITEEKTYPVKKEKSKGEALNTTEKEESEEKQVQQKDDPTSFQKDKPSGYGIAKAPEFPADQRQEQSKVEKEEKAYPIKKENVKGETLNTIEKEESKGKQAQQKDDTTSSPKDQPASYGIAKSPEFPADQRQEQSKVEKEEKAYPIKKENVKGETLNTIEKEESKGKQVQQKDDTTSSPKDQPAGYGIAKAPELPVDRRQEQSKVEKKTPNVRETSFGHWDVPHPLIIDDPKNIEDNLKKQPEWKNYQLNIGVVGFADVGKSSFINTFRRLNGNDAGAAPLDMNEKTTKPTPYKHPNNSNLKIWEIPGVWH